MRAKLTGGEVIEDIAELNERFSDAVPQVRELLGKIETCDPERLFA